MKVSFNGKPWYYISVYFILALYFGLFYILFYLLQGLKYSQYIIIKLRLT